MTQRSEIAKPSGASRWPDDSLAGAEPNAVEQKFATVPAKPSAAMLAAGARAGDVSVEQAWRVYQAMLRAAE